MEVPVVPDEFVSRTGSRIDYMKPKWGLVSVKKEHYEGPVYSLSVTPYRHYISGGIVVHNSVKGAEWRNCYVQMPKGKFPFEPRIKPGQEPPDPEDLQAEMESERRLAYVALTRAAKNLTVVCPKVVGGKAAGTSPFVDEAELTTGENVPKLAQAEGTEMKTARWAEDLVF